MSDILFVLSIMALAAFLFVTVDYLVDALFPPREPWDETDQLPTLGKALTREKS